MKPKKVTKVKPLPDEVLLEADAWVAAIGRLSTQLNKRHVRLSTQRKWYGLSSREVDHIYDEAVTRVTTLVRQITENKRRIMGVVISFDKGMGSK